MQIGAQTFCSTCCESGPFYTVQAYFPWQADDQCTQNRPSVLPEHKELPVRASTHQSVHLLSSVCSRCTARTVYIFDPQVRSSCQMYSWHQGMLDRTIALALITWFISTCCVCAAVSSATDSCRDSRHLPIFFPGDYLAI